MLFLKHYLILLLFAVRHYEVVYLIHEDHADEVDNVISKVQGIICTHLTKPFKLY